MTWHTALIEHKNLQMVPVLFKDRRMEGVALFTTHEAAEAHVLGTTTLDYEIRELGVNLTPEEFLVTLDAMLMFCADYRAALSIPVFVDPASFAFDPSVKPTFESLGTFVRLQGLIKSQADLLELIHKSGFTIALNHFKDNDQYVCVACRGVFTDPVVMRTAVAAFNEAQTEDMNVHLTEFGTREAALEQALAWVSEVL